MYQVNGRGPHCVTQLPRLKLG